MGAQVGRPLSADLLAKQTNVPRHYLTRVLQDLCNSGLVQSRSGPGGGYELTCTTSNLTILDVINTVEPIARIKNCPLGFNSHIGLCPLHAKLDNAYEATEKAFAGVTIQDLIESDSTSIPVCVTASRYE